MTFPRPCTRCGRRIPDPTKFQEVCTGCNKRYSAHMRDVWRFENREVKNGK